MRGIRFAVGAAGAALLLWGAWLLLSRQICLSCSAWPSGWPPSSSCTTARSP